MLWKRLLILPPVIAGFAVIYWATANRLQPETRDISERAVPVSYIVAETRSFVPRVTGFGVVEPGRSWNAVAQVQGRIVDLHTEFVRGGTVRAGQVIARIDPEAYDLAVAQAEANVRSGAAQLAELDANAEATRALLAIEREALDLAERELNRQRQLAERGQLAASAVESQQRALLSQRSAVQSLENQLNLVPAQRDALEQALAVSEASLDQARLDLDRTRILAPFDGRVAMADVDVGEFASHGSRLGTLDSIATAEIDAQVAPQDMAQLSRLIFADRGPSISPSNLAAERLTARVRLNVEGFDAEWVAKVDRITDGVDPQTRSIGVIVAVDNPYGLARAAERPPLIKGMFVEVELEGPVVEGVIVLPRRAIEGGKIMVINETGRLAFADVEIVFAQDDLALVFPDSLVEGTQVIVSTPSPAIPGTLLAPERDIGTEARLASTALPTATDAAGSGGVDE
ncbi:efflux RND transporter periplasmic adaptor subunit [Anianabacter salinae]|uniref:efflux RND transporter periplasmic adaptor subunit n=1 Tax=Anianabacter salinae TaxID=2851023 RepID=UPI00225E12C0|nr:HlyD family efflux transporter periplasmic adaptor subunit [Anianabacter salinae]MBV0913815.1 HlyD family efflux transporter periplasmic adaptor subunit [Anianabacter salinae]